MGFKEQPIEKLMVRLGPLARPLCDEAMKRKLSPTEIVRIAIAKELGVECPDMKAWRENRDSDNK